MAQIDPGTSKLSENKRPRLLRIVMAALIVTFLFASTMSLLPNPSSENPPAPVPVRIAYTAHANITIIGNAGFLAANASTGIANGSGTAVDPYIIEEWDIDASSFEGIYIQNANVHFIVRGCYIEGGEDMNRAIHLNNCTNGTVTGNVCIDNYDGVALENSYGITVSNNSIDNEDWLDEYGISIFGSSHDNIIVGNNCSHCDEGVYLSNSYNNTIVNNTIYSNVGCGINLWLSDGNTLVNNTCRSNSNEGILLEGSGHNTLSGNNCTGNYLGIYLLSSSNYNTLINNTCDSNTDYGMEISSSGWNTLVNNTCTNNDDGIDLYGSSHNILSNNTFSSNAFYGIYLQSSINNTLFNNNCSGATSGYGIALFASSNNNTLSGNNCSGNSADGMYFWGSDDNMLSNNTIILNGADGMALWSSSDCNTFFNNTCSSNANSGMLLSMSTNNTIAWNRFCNNTADGIFAAPGADRNTIWNNTFIGNNGVTGTYNPAVTQAEDDGADNRWNSSSGFGNYWSDLTSPDTVAPFGIVDWSYNLTGSSSSKDYYPLTTPSPVPPVIPEFSEIIIPIAGLMLIALILRKTRKDP